MAAKIVKVFVWRKKEIGIAQWQCLSIYFHVGLLSLANCLVGASLSASTAADAGVGINYIDVTLADSASWTHIHASSACYTVVTNYVCHNQII